MARFNIPVARRELTVNLAGGQAYRESARLELVSLLLTSFVADQYYRNQGAGAARVAKLVAEVDPLFAAKAAVYARRQFGMRTVTHIVAGEIAHRVKGQPWTKGFFSAVVRRPDDALEIAAYVLGTYGKPLPNSLKKGLAAALATFDGYQLAKYRAEGAGLKLVDLVNMVHPKPPPASAAAIQALVKGQLRSEDTWESMLTRAGQATTDEEGKLALKSEAWNSLIHEKKLGYFALLRNLRNISEQAPTVLPQALEMLVDEHRIRGSLVLPFRYSSAWQEVRQQSGAQSIVAALSRAATLSLGNVPRFDGSTLVALDVSGSMTGRPRQIGEMFAAILAGQGADLILFTDAAKYLSLGGNDLFGDIATIQANAVPKGTNFHSIFTTASRAYDRIIILSDMQAWMTQHAHHVPGNPAGALAEYRKRTGADPKIFSFDLQGYGSLQFPERNVFALAGFNDHAFKLMRMLESGESTLVDEVEKVSFTQ